MQYLGGKARIAKRIVEAIEREEGSDKRWVEPFVGGSWVLKEAGKKYLNLRANDCVEDLQLLYEAVARGWTPPKDLSKEEYDRLKNGEPSPLRAFAGFGTSFQGKWFAGYSWYTLNGKRSYRDIAESNLLKGKDVYQRTEFSTGSYLDVEVYPQDIVYCDPPYEGTTGYDASGSFDHGVFWEWAKSVSDLGASVYVSEYHSNPPVPAEVIWSREAKQTMKFTGGNPVKTETLLRVL